MTGLRVCLLFAILVPVGALAGEASGEFSVTDRPPIRPKYAVAFETRDPGNARKTAIEVVLSETPVDIAAAVAELDPHTNLINQKALFDHDYVMLWVRPDNDVSMNATCAMTQYVDRSGGSMKAELSVNTPDKVAGRFFSLNPVKTMSGEKYSVDLKFSTEVTRPQAGTKLPAGGGEPGKAYKALQAAIAKKSWDEIGRNVTATNRKKFTDEDRTPKENLDGALESLGFWLPKGVGKITGGEMRGDSAVLNVEAEIFKGMNGLFLIRMVKEGPRWVFDQATKAGIIDE